MKQHDSDLIVNYDIVFQKKKLKDAVIERLSILWNRYKRQCLAVLFFIVTILVIIILSAVPPFNNLGTSRDPSRINQDPSSLYWLGTNYRGQNMFNMLLTGTRNSIIFGFVTSILCTSIAILVGVIGPFIGGVVDKITQFITNIALIFPIIPFIILMSTLTEERTTLSTLLIIAFFNWPWAARSIRAQVLSIKERDYIKVSRMSGVSSTRIAFSEVLPNVLSYVFLCFVIITGIAIQIEAGIALLGLGQQDYLTLGWLLTDAIENQAINTFQYHLWIPPGVILMLFLLLIYNLHGSFSSTFNPKSRETI